LLTTVPPNYENSVPSTNSVHNPYSAVIPPPPFPYVSLQSTAYYLLTTKLFQSDYDYILDGKPARSEFQFCPFRKTGSYVELLGTRGYVNSSGHVTSLGMSQDYLFVNISLVTGGSHTVYKLTNNNTSAGEVFPLHAMSIKVTAQLSSGSSTVWNAAFYSDAGEINLSASPYVGFVFSNPNNHLDNDASTGYEEKTMEIPLYVRDPVTNKPVFFVILTYTSGAMSALLQGDIIGYYE
jgi:hypothetical protein